MGTLTYSGIKTEVLANLGNRTNFDASRFVNILNMSQMRIARVHKWNEMEDLVEGTFVITADAKVDKILAIPADTRKVYTFRIIKSNGESRKLIKKTNTYFDTYIPEPEYYARGTPTVYMTFKDQFEFWRVPDSAMDYSIRRRKWPTAFVGDGTPTQLSDFDEKDDALVALTSNWLLQSLGRMEDAGRWWTVYTNIVNAMAREEVEDPDMTIMPDFNRKLYADDYCNDPVVYTYGPITPAP